MRSLKLHTFLTLVLFISACGPQSNSSSDGDGRNLSPVTSTVSPSVEFDDEGAVESVSVFQAELNRLRELGGDELAETHRENIEERNRITFEDRPETDRLGFENMRVFILETGQIQASFDVTYTQDGQELSERVLFVSPVDILGDEFSFTAIEQFSLREIVVKGYCSDESLECTNLIVEPAYYLDIKVGMQFRARFPTDSDTAVVESREVEISQEEAPEVSSESPQLLQDVSFEEHQTSAVPEGLVSEEVAPSITEVPTLQLEDFGADTETLNIEPLPERVVVEEIEVEDFESPELVLEVGVESSQFEESHESAAIQQPELLIEPNRDRPMILPNDIADTTAPEMQRVEPEVLEALVVPQIEAAPTRQEILSLPEVDPEILDSVADFEIQQPNPAPEPTTEIIGGLELIDVVEEVAIEHVQPVENDVVVRPVQPESLFGQVIDSDQLYVPPSNEEEFDPTVSMTGHTALGSVDPRDEDVEGFYDLSTGELYSIAIERTPVQDELLNDILNKSYNQAKGSYSDGHLTNAVHLEREIEGAVVNPDRANHQWGSGLSVDFLKYVADRYNDLDSENNFCVNNLSLQGGRNTPSSSSHENGLEVDISYASSINRCSRRSHFYVTWSRLEQLDDNFLEKNWDLLKLMLIDEEVKNRIDMIFTDKAFMSSLCVWAKEERKNDDHIASIMSKLYHKNQRQRHYQIRLVCNQQNSGCTSEEILINPERQVDPNTCN